MPLVSTVKPELERIGFKVGNGLVAGASVVGVIRYGNRLP